MIQTATKIGPQDHGRQMTLAEFEPASGMEGYLYELSRGMVIVMDVPGVPHLLQVCETRNQLVRYHLDHPKRIFAIAGGSDCKILLSDFESERHPDLAVYLSPPPDEKRLWAYWVPDIVIEVISLGSEERDYVLKSEEYFAFGVKEYWIIDGRRQELLVLRRGRGGWTKKTVKPADAYETKPLPGFRLNCKAVFQAARNAR
jgi:Uma2 family endonuclease